MADELISALQSMRDRMISALPPKFGDAFDGDMDTLLEAINRLKRNTRHQPNGGAGAEDARDGYVTLQRRDVEALLHYARDARPMGAEGLAWMSARRVRELLAMSDQNKGKV